MRDDAMKHQIVKSRGQPEMSSLTLRWIEGFVVAIDMKITGCYSLWIQSLSEKVQDTPSIISPWPLPKKVRLDP